MPARRLAHRLQRLGLWDQKEPASQKSSCLTASRLTSWRRIKSRKVQTRILEYVSQPMQGIAAEDCADSARTVNDGSSGPKKLSRDHRLQPIDSGKGPISHRSTSPWCQCLLCAIPQQHTNFEVRGIPIWEANASGNSRKLHKTCFNKSSHSPPRHP